MTKPTDELLARTRRIETRLTQLLIAAGIDTQVQRPVFDAQQGRLRVPSIHSSLKEITASIPEGWTSPVELIIGGTRLGQFVPGG